METGAEKGKAWEESNLRQHWQVSTHKVTGTPAHGEEGILPPSQFTVQEHQVIAGRHGVRDPPPLGFTRRLRVCAPHFHSRHRLNIGFACFVKKKLREQDPLTPRAAGAGRSLSIGRGLC